MRRKLTCLAGAFAASLVAMTSSPVMAREPFLGEVMAFAGNFCPRGWAEADGRTLPVSQNTSLFSILGTIYGGDGRTDFALPDLRGRTIVGRGRSPSSEYESVQGQPDDGNDVMLYWEFHPELRRYPTLLSLPLTYCIAVQGVFPSRN